MPTSNATACDFDPDGADKRRSMHAPTAAGKDARGWTRYVCRNCGRFYGYIAPDVKPFIPPNTVGNSAGGSPDRNLFKEPNDDDF